jgi:hypothetical protein
VADSSPSLTGGFNLPFAEQIAFFRQKLNLPTAAWDDVWQAAHDRSFVVAGATKADLLDDLRQAIDKAIATGTTLETFRKDFKILVAKNGWTGWTGEGSKAGIAWRTRVIYETNLRSSYAAGRWVQLNDPHLAQLMPYWRYVHDDSVLSPRPEHAQWGAMGLTLPRDHPFWQTHFPPNGWGCRCRVVAVMGPKPGQATEPPPGWNTIDPKTGAPVGIGKGWGDAPGASLGDELKTLVDQKIGKLPEPLAGDLAADVDKVVNRPPFVTARTAKEAAQWAVEANLVDAADYAGIHPAVANAFNRSLYEHLGEFPALRVRQRFIGSAQAQNALWREFEIEHRIKELRAESPDMPPGFDFRKVAQRHVKAVEVPNIALGQSRNHPDAGGIAVNDRFGADPEMLLEYRAYSVKTGHHPKGTASIRATADHEMGHQLDYLLGLRVDPEIVALYNEAMTLGMRQEVSGYAATSINEFIAECWAEFRNSPAPRPIAARLGARVRRRYMDQFQAP